MRELSMQDIEFVAGAGVASDMIDTAASGGQVGGVITALFVGAARGAAAGARAGVIGAAAGAAIGAFVAAYEAFDQSGTDYNEAGTNYH